MQKHHFVPTMVATVVALGISGTVLATPMSDRTEASAKKSYVFVKYLNGDDIKIHTDNDSSVTLTGTVLEWSHRSLAEETVASLPGVKHVNNKLEVKGGYPAENSDVWLAVKVKTSLLFGRNVSSINTKVDVKDGIVTLGGEAISVAQKELTAEFVNDVNGVKGIKNNMTVQKTEPTVVEKVSEYIDDASITAQVKIALLFHRSTSAMGTRVDTKDGVVTVRGIAKNSAERDLVGKLVDNIKGVKSVKNELTLG